MSVGGARPGAGRKPGGKNRATIEREANAAAAIERVQTLIGETLTLDQVAAMSEIDVMRHAMLLAAMAQNWNVAATWAKEIAPYRFAKLTSAKVDATVRRSLEEMSDDELVALAGGDEGESGDCSAGERAE